MSANPRLSTKIDQTAHRRILTGLREQISTGNFEPGTRLPSVRELAATWQASVYTLQTVLGALSREGWLQLRHGSGTFITDPRKRFITAGIYQSWDIAESSTPPFTRNLHFALLHRLEASHKNVHVFIDSRPDSKQTKLLPSLAEAIRERRIQCVISPTTNRFNAATLSKLAVPHAFLSNSSSANRADYSAETMLPEATRHLATRCRSVGIVSTIVDDPALDYYATFDRAVAGVGLLTHNEWIRKPSLHPNDFELYGYQAFKKFWKLSRKPEALIVYPDTAVKGVILAILEIGVRKVTDSMQFVFHRNAQLPILCPFCATWAIANENLLANALIQQIEKQFRGERIKPVHLPYLFKELKSSM